MVQERGSLRGGGIGQVLIKEVSYGDARPWRSYLNRQKEENITECEVGMVKSNSLVPIRI